MSDFKYLGDFAACEVWAARYMTCDKCKVSWTGCWDNFMCPQCGEGELPSCETSGMTIRELTDSLLSARTGSEAGE